MNAVEALVAEMALGGSEYVSPRGEASLFKGIPIEVYDHPIMVRFRRARGLKGRFRGPRYDANAQTCLKAHARTFALYKRTDIYGPA